MEEILEGKMTCRRHGMSPENPVIRESLDQFPGNRRCPFEVFLEDYIHTVVPFLLTKGGQSYL
jgi:hypothetical protein